MSIKSAINSALAAYTVATLITQKAVLAGTMASMSTVMGAVDAIDELKAMYEAVYSEMDYVSLFAFPSLGQYMDVTMTTIEAQQIIDAEAEVYWNSVMEGFKDVDAQKAMIDAAVESPVVKAIFAFNEKAKALLSL